MSDKFFIDPQAVVFAIVLLVSAGRSFFIKIKAQNTLRSSSKKNRNTTSHFGSPPLPSQPIETPQTSHPQLTKDASPQYKRKQLSPSQPKKVLRKSPPLKKRLRSASGVKEAFVVSEILGKPKGL